MTGIIIGAGRGKRLMPLTADLPKCLLPVGPRRCAMDWILDSFSAAGIKNIIFVGGFQMASVIAAYPDLKFIENRDWEQTNILTSLMCALHDVDQPVVISYSDIIYETGLIRRLIQVEHDVNLAVDPNWRSRYCGRLLHPEAEAEKIVGIDGRVLELGKHLEPGLAYGEFLGVAHFSVRLMREIRRIYHAHASQGVERPFQRAASLRAAYLTDMLQELICCGFSVHFIHTTQPWYELDTAEDLERAQIQCSIQQ